MKYQLIRPAIPATTDLAEPTTPPPHQVQPPPEDSETVQHVVEILLAAYAVEKTASMIAAIVPGIPAAIFAAVLHTAGGVTGHRAHAPLQRLGLDPGTAGAKVASSAARSEVFYRASYILRAAARVETDVRAGKSIEEAVRDEVPVFRSHEAARRGRLGAAAAVGKAANMFGNLLGWYLNPVLDNEAECIAASGNNFYADEGTIIGWPGAVHPRCGCVSGPPHEGAGMVNDALAGSRAVVLTMPKRYGLKKRKAG